MNMLRLNPLREFDSLFNFYNPSLQLAKSDSKDWTPQVDIVEGQDNITITAELAGIPKEAINVSVDKQVLTISGERKIEKDDQKHHRIERFYGSFTRSFSLPDYVDSANIKAESKDGILSLTLPKSAPKSQQKTIEIH